MKLTVVSALFVLLVASQVDESIARRSPAWSIQTLVTRFNRGNHAAWKVDPWPMQDASVDLSKMIWFTKSRRGVSFENGIIKGFGLITSDTPVKGYRKGGVYFSTFKFNMVLDATASCSAWFDLLKNHGALEARDIKIEVSVLATHKLYGHHRREVSLDAKIVSPINVKVTRMGIWLRSIDALKKAFTKGIVAEVQKAVDGPLTTILTNLYR